MDKRHCIHSLAFFIAIDAAVASLRAAPPPPPTQANPAAQSSGTISASDRTKQFSLTVDSNNQLYWFTYVSDGKSAVRFDTLGSNFSTGGGGQVLPSSNESQIGVYTSSGTKVALAKGVEDSAGNPISQFPYYTSTDVYTAQSPTGTLWYGTEGLSQLTLAPHAQTSNPHWLVSPTDSTPYTGWSATPTPTHPLGNPGNSQRYYPPDYYVPLNEYQVWNTALSTVVLNNQGQPVDRNGNVVSAANAQPQPGWRYSDRDRVGPGSAWNQGSILPAGTYYIAVATSTPLLQGDTGREEMDEAPVNYYFDEDSDSIVGPTSLLSGPLGSFQYLDDPASNNYSGTLKLNVTKGTALEWNNAGGSGNGTVWDVGSNQNFNDSTAPITYTSGDYVTFDDNNNGHYNVVLNTAVTPFAIYASNSNGNYSLTGSGSINGIGGFTKDGTGTFTLGTANTYTGETIVNQGTLNVTGSITGTAVTVAAGASLILKPTSLLATIPEYAKNAVTPTMVAPNLTVNGTVSITAPAANSGFNPIYVNILTLGAGAKITIAPGTHSTEKSVVDVLSLASFPATARIDLGGDLILQNVVVSTLIPRLMTGLNAGTGYWNGTTGIASTAAANDTRHLTTLGYRQSPGGLVDGINTTTSDSLVKYTYYGDADLNGSVNGGDYALIDTGFGMHLTGWGNGDFNYDGVVNGTDYALMDNTFNQINATNAGSLAIIATPASLVAGSAVPEPATLGLLAAGAIGLMSRAAGAAGDEFGFSACGGLSPMGQAAVLLSAR